MDISNKGRPYEFCPLCGKKISEPVVITMDETPVMWFGRCFDCAMIFRSEEEGVVTQKPYSGANIAGIEPAMEV